MQKSEEKRVKIIKIFLAFLTVATVLLSAIGCGEVAVEDDDIKIVTTIFPYYDITKNIINGANGVSLSLLVGDGADLHSYNATARDIIEISSADILIMAGGESDAWVEAALKESQNKDIEVVRLVDELHSDGLAIPADSHEHEHNETCVEAHLFDEHIWLSPKMAGKIVEYITDALTSLDSTRAEQYVANAALYGERISALDSSFAKTLADTNERPIVFADRFPFAYLARDYSLLTFAAFSGCSSDSEASFSTVTSLASYIDNYSLSKIYVTESSTGDLARSVITASGNPDCEIIVLDSMQSITKTDIQNAANYIEIMEQNLMLLKG